MHTAVEAVGKAAAYIFLAMVRCCALESKIYDSELMNRIEWNPEYPHLVVAA
jgi:hypothetical protein